MTKLDIWPLKINDNFFFFWTILIKLIQFTKKKTKNKMLYTKNKTSAWEQWEKIYKKKNIDNFCCIVFVNIVNYTLFEKK